MALPPDDFLNEYRDAASRHGAARTARAAFAAADRLVAIYEVLRERHEKERLIPLLSDAEASVRLWAAAHVLELAPDQATPVLEALGKDSVGLHQAHAFTMLQEWRAGRLRSPSELFMNVSYDEAREPAEILGSYLDGERDFRGLQILDPSNGVAGFTGQLLDGANFSHCAILADFTNASLRGCKFAHANVKTCSFDGADLRGCDFSNAAVDSATFRSAKVDGATFAGASAYGHTFRAGEIPDG